MNSLAFCDREAVSTASFYRWPEPAPGAALMFCPEGQVSAPVRPAGGHAYTPRHWKPHFADQPLRFALHTRAVA